MRYIIDQQEDERFRTVSHAREVAGGWDPGRYVIRRLPDRKLIGMVVVPRDSEGPTAYHRAKGGR